MANMDIQLSRAHSPVELALEALQTLDYGQRDNFFLEKELFGEEGYVSYIFYHEEFAFMSSPIEICVTPEGLVLFYHSEEECWYGLINSAEVFYEYIFSPKPKRKPNKRKRDR